MTRILLVAGTAALAFAGVAAAKPGNGHGHGYGLYGDKAVHGMHGRYGAVGYGVGGCPPGLAKKRIGCMPPGQAKKLLRTERFPYGFGER